MIRKLLATTALASMIASGAFAQGTTAPATDAPVSASPAGTAEPAATTDATSTSASANGLQGQYLQTLGANQYLASDFTGKSVYQTEAADSEAAGKIDNLLVGSDGKVLAAVIDTGSYLGDSKTVAVPFSKLTWAMGKGNEPRAVLTASKEELMAAPAFTETTAADAANAGAAVPATGADTTAATTEAMTSAAMPSGDYAATVAGDQYLSEDIVGSKVYGGPGADAESIGSVNDLVISSAGDVAAGVIGVGGFLGIGEKNVGVPFAELQLTREDGNEPRVVLAATKEQLTAAPTFEDEPEDVASTASSSGSVADATSSMPSQGASAGAAAGAAIGSAADSAATAANEAGDAISSAATDMSNSVSTAANDTATATGNAADDAATATGTAADATTTASTGGAIDRASLSPATGPELTAEKLVGTNVYGPNDESIGEVGDIALNATGQVDAIIVDVGGFLGLGQKPVAVAMDNLQFMKDSGGSLYLYTQFTQDQLKNAPEYDSETYTQNRGTMRLGSGAAGATTPAPATAQ